jgi:hypothetical protein
MGRHASSSSYFCQTNAGLAYEVPVQPCVSVDYAKILVSLVIGPLSVFAYRTRRHIYTSTLWEQKILLTPRPSFRNNIKRTRPADFPLSYARLGCLCALLPAVACGQDDVFLKSSAFQIIVLVVFGSGSYEQIIILLCCLVEYGMVLRIIILSSQKTTMLEIPEFKKGMISQENFRSRI